jgi:hypothetical protein
MFNMPVELGVKHRHPYLNSTALYSLLRDEKSTVHMGELEITNLNELWSISICGRVLTIRAISSPIPCSNWDLLGCLVVQLDYVPRLFYIGVILWCLLRMWADIICLTCLSVIWELCLFLFTQTRKGWNSIREFRLTNGDQEIVNAQNI